MAERIEMKTRVAGLLVVSAMFLVLGGILVMVATSGRHHSVGLALFGGIIAAVPLALTLMSMRRRLIIDDRRIVAKGFFGTAAIPWDEVDHYRYWSLGQQGVYATGGGGVAGVIIVAVIFAVAKAVRKAPGNRKFSLGGMKIFGSDGQRIKLDHRYKDMGALLDRCFDEMHGRMRTKPREYAPFTVTDSDLVHDKKGPIALAEIEKIGVSGGRLTVRKRGKRLAWAASGMRGMKNVMLLVDDLAERGMVIDAQDEVFVPVPVLAKLRAAAARHTALPAAKVVRR